jgi:hypothetical protein
MFLRPVGLSNETNDDVIPLQQPLCLPPARRSITQGEPDHLVSVGRFFIKGPRDGKTGHPTALAS